MHGQNLETTMKSVVAKIDVVIRLQRRFQNLAAAFSESSFF